MPPVLFEQSRDDVFLPFLPNVLAAAGKLAAHCRFLRTDAVTVVAMRARI